MRKSNREIYEQRKKKQHESQSSVSAVPSRDRNKAAVKAEKIRDKKPKHEPAESKGEVIGENEAAESKNRKKRNNRRGRKSLILVVTVVLLLAFCAAGIYGVYYLVSDLRQDTVPATGETIGEEPLHCYFVLGSYNAFQVAAEETPVALDGETIDRGGHFMVPLKGLASVLDLSIEDKGDGSYALNKGEKTLTLAADTDRAYLGEEAKTLSYTPFYQYNCLYVPARDISEAFGLKCEYTASANRVDIYAPVNRLLCPKVYFFTDKEVYAPGEKVKFVAVASSSDNGGVVEYKWDNKHERYFNKGKEEISLSVKDYNGQWSQPVVKEITIEGDDYVPASSTPVFMYHWLTDNESDVRVGGNEYGNAAVMGMEQFRFQMEYIKNNGYNTLFVSEFLSYLRNGTLPPPKSVVIIFDDGYENNYTLGYPVIKELGLKANIAVIFEHSINKSDNPDYVETISPRLTMEEIEEMQASGCIEIGSHTYAGHSPGESYQCREGYFMVEPAYNKSLGRQETEAEFFNRVEDDTFKAKELMRQRLGIDDPFFVYPYGRVGSEIESSIKKAGFNSAFIIGDAYAKSSVDLYKIPRFTMAPRISNEEFASIISGKGFLPPPEPVKPKEEKKEASEKKEG